VVSGGKVFIGTNNGAGTEAPKQGVEDLSRLLCFDAATGKVLWQYSSPKLPSGRVHDWPQVGLCSTPFIDGSRLWVVTNRCTVVCLDVEGFRDNENDGTVQNESSKSENAADVIWEFDMMKELGVRPLHQAVSSITCAGELLLLNTSNGPDESYVKIPAPDAPSFVALNRNTGQLIWQDNSPGKNLLGGQCPGSSPAVGTLDGVPQAIFAGGDGWLYSFDVRGIQNGKSELLWRFDCNPKQSVWKLGGQGTRNTLVATPVICDGLVYIAVGRNPEQGEGPGHLWCIDPSKRGDISAELVFNKNAQSGPIPHKPRQACEPEKGDYTIANANSGVVWHYASFDLNKDGRIEFE
jgi:outer membrane protein assembly factor BamB